MTETKSVIVVANQTATAPELIATLSQLAGSEPTRFTLVVPPAAWTSTRRKATRSHAISWSSNSG